MRITLDDAERIMAAAKKKAKEMGFKVTISIVDARGDLILMARMDGSSWQSALLSQGKAVASASYGLPSAELAERANRPVMHALMMSERGRFIPQQGAVPIKKNEVLLGAIGVSGVSSRDDEIIAFGGLAAF